MLTFIPHHCRWLLDQSAVVVERGPQSMLVELTFCAQLHQILVSINVYTNTTCLILNTVAEQPRPLIADSRYRMDTKSWLFIEGLSIANSLIGPKKQNNICQEKDLLSR